MPSGLLPVATPAAGTSALNPQAVVETFLARLAAGDVSGAGGLLADDVVYTNVGLPTLHGRRRVVRALSALGGPRLSFEVYLHAITASGPVVLTERTDVICAGPVRDAVLGGRPLRRPGRAGHALAGCVRLPRLHPCSRARPARCRGSGDSGRPRRPRWRPRPAATEGARFSARPAPDRQYSSAVDPRGRCAVAGPAPAPVRVDLPVGDQVVRGRVGDRRRDHVARPDVGAACRRRAPACRRARGRTPGRSRRPCGRRHR